MILRIFRHRILGDYSDCGAMPSKDARIAIMLYARVLVVPDRVPPKEA
jgi:hypothetical protein